MARAKLLLQEIETYAQNIGDTVRDPLLILDRDLCVKSANRAFYNTFHVTPEDTEDRLIGELGDGQWNAPALLDPRRDSGAFVTREPLSDLGAGQAQPRPEALKEVKELLENWGYAAPSRKP